MGLACETRHETLISHANRAKTDGWSYPKVHQQLEYYSYFCWFGGALYLELGLTVLPEMNDFIHSPQFCEPVAKQLGAGSSNVDVLRGELQKLPKPRWLNGIRPEFVEFVISFRMRTCS